METENAARFNELYVHLRLAHPLPTDDYVRFSEEGHEYNVRGEDGSWEDSNVMSMGSFLDACTPKFPTFIVEAVKKSLNKRYQYWHEICERDHMYFNPKSVVFLSRTAEILWPDKYDVFLPPHLFRPIYKNDYETVRDQGYKIPHIDGPFTNQDVQDGWVRDGKRIHSAIEAYLNQAPIPRNVDCSQMIEWTYFMHFLRDHPHWIPYRTEVNVVLPRNSSGKTICGRIDAIFQDKLTGEFILVDWKHSKKLKQRRQDDDDADTEDVLTGPFQGIRATSRNKYFIKKNLYYIASRHSLHIQYTRMYLLIIHRSNPSYVLIDIPIFEKRFPDMSERLDLFLRGGDVAPEG